ncbi:MAG: ATP-binding cassette domain-containing protein, partial [Pontimonas sp.]
GTPAHPYTQHLLDSMPSRKKHDPSRNREVVHAEIPVIAGTGLGRRHINQGGGEFVALHEVSLRVAPGTTLGIVGESGSGKTTLARILMGLEDADSGVVEFEGTPWAPAPERARRPRRGAIQLIEQNPYDALDPRWSVAKTIGEAIALDRTLRHPTARNDRLMELLEQVGLSDQLLARRPHQLSGGQRQRVAIARALARRPKVLICDEPVSALDASVRAHILLLLNTLQRNLGLSLIVISHDLGVIAQVSDNVLVLHEGRVVESGSLEAVVNHAQHPFTKELLAASPAIVA